MPSISSKPIAEHAEVPLADEGKLEEIVAHWRERGEGGDAAPTRTEDSLSYVVSVGTARDPRVRAFLSAVGVDTWVSLGGSLIQ